MALADLAFDLIYIMHVLKHLGVVFDEMPEATTHDPEAHALVERVGADEVHGPVTAETDSKAAHDLCHRDSSGGGKTRHLDRKEFKMRELRKRKKVAVKLVRTEDMEADILTKILPKQLFDKHRRSLKNLSAA